MTISMVKSARTSNKARKQHVTPPQHQPHQEKHVKLSYLECAKKALPEQECQGLLRENKGLQQPVSTERHTVNGMDASSLESGFSEKHEASLSDCETLSGDNASSEHSESELSDSEHLNTSVAPTVEENNTNISTASFPVPTTPPAAPLPVFPMPNLVTQPLDCDAVYRSSHKQRLTPSMLATEPSNKTQKLSCEARLFVPEASNKTKKLSCEAKLFVPMAPRGQMSTSALAWSPMVTAKASHLHQATPSNIPPPVAPSQAFIPPPGLSMLLRKEAAAFVPAATSAS